MYLENVVIDSVQPRTLGRFWETALGSQRLTDTEELFETRLSVSEGRHLDVCFPRVPASPCEDLRLHLDLSGTPEQRRIVERLRSLGAVGLDIGQGDVDWVVLADPEGNPFCVLTELTDHTSAGPIAAIPIDSSNPIRDAEFWAWLTGWESVPGEAAELLRHPSGHGLTLEFWAEHRPKPKAKNRIHLDIRLETGDGLEAVLDEVTRREGHELNPGWGPLPWSVCSDPSGNEFCLLSPL